MQSLTRVVSLKAELYLAIRLSTFDCESAIKELTNSSNAKSNPLVLSIETNYLLKTKDNLYNANECLLRERNIEKNVK